MAKKHKTAKKRKPAKKQKPIARKRQRVKGVTTKSKSHTDKNKFRNVDISIGAVNEHIKIARRGLEKQLSDKMLEHYKAQTKMSKRQLQKQINVLKSKIKKLS